MPQSRPLTRPVTIMIHEQAYDSLRLAAKDKCKGSVSKYIRLLLYAKLVSDGKIPLTFMEALYGPK